MVPSSDEIYVALQELYMHAPGWVCMRGSWSTHLVPSSDQMCVQLLELRVLYMLVDRSVCKVPRTCT